MSGVASHLPYRAWRSPALLGAISRIAGPALGAGQLRLEGLAPNGQRFHASPRIIWVATRATGSVTGADLGELGPAPKQARLRDFAIPQRGLFAVTGGYFTTGADR